MSKLQRCPSCDKTQEMFTSFMVLLEQPKNHIYPCIICKECTDNYGSSPSLSPDAYRAQLGERIRANPARYGSVAIDADREEALQWTIGQPQTRELIRRLHRSAFRNIWISD